VSRTLGGGCGKAPFLDYFVGVGYCRKESYHHIHSSSTAKILPENSGAVEHQLLIIM
jgi:hypothetical protein